MDIDTDTATARITIWESGEFDAEILSVSSGDQLFWQHGVAALDAPLDDVFEPFLKQLLETGLGGRSI